MLQLILQQFSEGELAFLNFGTVSFAYDIVSQQFSEGELALFETLAQFHFAAHFTTKVRVSLLF